MATNNASTNGSSTGQRRNLDAIVAQRSEALGGDTIEFDFGGETFSMPHPLLADDEWKIGMRESGDDDIAAARSILGDEQYDRFRAAGGRAGYIILLMQQVTSEMQETTAGGDPTQSSTSSNRTQRRQKQT